MSTPSSDHRMMIPYIPDDPKILEALGTISLRHSFLDHILRMTVKSLTGISIQDAMDGTAFQGSSTLRKRILRIARDKLGEGSALIELQAILERCRRATERRNDVIHSIWAQELDGDPKVRTENGWKPIPNVTELNALSEELVALTKQLNTARLEGFLAKALEKKKPAIG